MFSCFNLWTTSLEGIPNVKLHTGTFSSTMTFICSSYVIVDGVLTATFCTFKASRKGAKYVSTFSISAVCTSGVSGTNTLTPKDYLFAFLFPEYVHEVV